MLLFDFAIIEGLSPPFAGLAVKVTGSPEQMVSWLADKVTSGMELGVTEKISGNETTGL